MPKITKTHENQNKKEVEKKIRRTQKTQGNYNSKTTPEDPQKDNLLLVGVWQNNHLADNEIIYKELNVS